MLKSTDDCSDFKIFFFCFVAKVSSRECERVTEEGRRKSSNQKAEERKKE
jgi:hypothetical protein